jgi:hypothetical protein
VIGGKWWKEASAESKQRAQRRCNACGRFSDKLEAHESYEVDYVNARLYFVEVVALCWFCHRYIHQSQLAAMVAKGAIPKELADKVIQHGEGVLRSYGLVKPPSEPDLNEWQDWRMIFNGKAYPPRFLNEIEWQEYHDRK